MNGKRNTYSNFIEIYDKEKSMEIVLKITLFPYSSFEMQKTLYKIVLMILSSSHPFTQVSRQQGYSMSSSDSVHEIQRRAHPYSE